jgi:hypothetical protein
MITEAETTFDVFLSHAHTEAEAVESLAANLEDEHAIKVWLDRWVLIPGEHWQQEMAKGLDQARTCAVCVGNNTPSGWFSEEIQRALNRQTKDKSFRVIPVILPEGNRDLVDNFLELRTWVDFRAGIQDVGALHLLLCGIKGIPPGRGPRTATHGANNIGSLKSRLADLRDLRTQNLIDAEIALEYQRRILDEHMKKER